MADTVVREATVADRLSTIGIERRTFLKFCSTLAAVLALPPAFARDIAHALQTVRKPALVWLEFQDCAGNTESFLRASNPSVADIVLDVLSIDYHETIMAAAGHQAEAAKESTIAEGGHFVVVEGSVPRGEGGAFCTIAGRTALQHLEEAAVGAAAIINVGTCSSFGGIPAAAPNPTAAVAVSDVVSGVPIINLPGCPTNAANVTATFVHYLTFGGLPALDSDKRPLFAYGQRIHDSCERRGHFDAGQFVEEWGDEAHRNGWCLYKMGCKGPQTFHNCPAVRWNDGTSWPIQAGHGCVGCSEPGFWDAMSPFYKRLPKVPGFGVETTADTIGMWLAGATAVGFAAHGGVKAMQRRAGGPARGRIDDGPPDDDGTV
ncbi:MAG: hydrogenase small subunit [Acidimicrobiia bacterium]|nr:hydrogenase small subunit [Acidimicrobiia bacterium]